MIRSGGKQYRVGVGDIVEIDKLPVAKDATVTFDDVLLWVADPSTSSGQVGRQIKIGTPRVNDVSVKAKVLEQKKGEKIRVAKFKSKVRYRRVTGFRAQLTRVQIKGIETGNSSKLAEKTPATKVVKQSHPKR